MTAGVTDPPQLGRIVRPADYVRVLATPMRLRSPHFAVHHLEGRPLPVKPAARAATTAAPVNASLSTELSTVVEGRVPADVDDLRGAASGEDDVATIAPAGPQRWLGLVVPKKHAKRAVTRTLVKRQIRNVAAQCAAGLEPGLWVVRQRSPFDPKQYPSAASDALKAAARAELRALFERAVRGERDRLKPREPKGKPPPAVPPGESSCAA
jgi:ribonuclease P protein component